MIEIDCTVVFLILFVKVEIHIFRRIEVFPSLAERPTPLQERQPLENVVEMMP